MSKNHIIKVCVTQYQYERIRNKARAKGHSMSEYLRRSALEHSSLIETKIIETHKIVEQIKEKLERKKEETEEEKQNRIKEKLKDGSFYQDIHESETPEWVETFRELVNKAKQDK